MVSSGGQRHRPPAARVAAGVPVVLLAAAAAWFLSRTPTGWAISHDTARVAAGLRQTVADHPVATPAAFWAAYVGLAVLCLPVWWMQIAAGVAFGLWAGGGLCLTGSAAAAAATAAAADWFAGDWFHARIESRMARLRWIDDVLGHNGLLTVMTLRLTHLVPFGVSNLALGLSRVSTWAILVGTLVGNVPAVAAYVGLGAGYRPKADWPFVVALVAINAALLVPLAVQCARRLKGRTGIHEGHEGARRKAQN